MSPRRTSHQPPDGAAWRNRIIGSTEEDPAQLLANPRNWRTHPGPQRDAMRGALAEVGWVQQVIVNDRTGHLLDGHMRVEEALSAGAPSIPVLHVDLSEEEERLVLAVLDPIGAMADRSQERLLELIGEVTVGDEGLARMLERLSHDYGRTYSTDVKVPRYEPTGERPAVEALFDEERAAKLRRAILDARLPDDVTRFLLAGANRHVRFNYAAIAEFYAHAPAEVQRLMEDSALVIIDFGDAIRNGYVSFTETIAEIADGDRDG